MADLLESESVAVILHGLSILVSLVLAIITFMAVRQSKKTADSTLVERNNLTILGLLVAVVLAGGCGGSKTEE